MTQPQQVEYSVNADRVINRLNMRIAQLSGEVAHYQAMSDQLYEENQSLVEQVKRMTPAEPKENAPKATATKQAAKKAAPRKQTTPQSGSE